MEQCDGVEASRIATGYGPVDMKNLIKNQNSGGSFVLIIFFFFFNCTYLYSEGQIEAG